MDIKIGLVSFVDGKDRKKGENPNGMVKGRSRKIDKKRPGIVTRLINENKDLDILVFPGWALPDRESIDRVKKDNKNKKTFVFIEAGLGMHIIRHKKLIKKNLWQCFSKSSDINESPEKVRCFLGKLKTDRRFRIKSCVGRLLICGEINILKNKQKKDNVASFRFTDYSELTKLWNGLCKKTKIFINPAHTMMGNQGKFKKRRELFSRSERIYCFTTNNSAKGDFKKNTSLQYLYYNGKELENPYCQEIKVDYMLRKFAVPLD